MSLGWNFAQAPIVYFDFAVQHSFRKSYQTSGKFKFVRSGFWALSLNVEPKMTGKWLDKLNCFYFDKLNSTVVSSSTICHIVWLMCLVLLLSCSMHKDTRCAMNLLADLVPKKSTMSKMVHTCVTNPVTALVSGKSTTEITAYLCKFSPHVDVRISNHFLDHFSELNKYPVHRAVTGHSGKCFASSLLPRTVTIH